MKIAVQTFGCSANIANGEVLKGSLVDAGFEITDTVDDANLFICNSCAVKGPTENRIIDMLKRLPNNKKVIVTGCLPMINLDRMLKEVRFDALVRPALGKEIVDVVNDVLSGKRIVNLEGALSAKPDLNLSRLSSNSVVSIIPVNYGCLGSCAYCCVRYARGNLRSYREDEIIERVKDDIKKGFREFWLTSQDTASYGREIKTNLAELLFKLGKIEGDFKIRVGMMTPNVVAPISTDLIDAFRSQKIFKFLHLPIQSGDDTTLQRMNRNYSVNQYKEIIRKFRNKLSDLTVATDIICGFPGETEEAFQNTLNLLREIKPDITNISKFFARPHTPATDMRDQFVSRSIIKQRSRQASDIVKQISLECNKKWLGWKGQIIVDEKGKIPGSWIGRNFAYKPITISSKDQLLGSDVQVKIVRTFSTYLHGSIVS